MADDNPTAEGEGEATSSEGGGGRPGGGGGKPRGGGGKPMGRPPKDDAATNLSIRLTRADRGLLDGLVDRQRGWLASVGVTVSVAPPDVIRALIRREAASGIEGPVGGPAPASAASTGGSSASSSATTTRGPVEHSEVDPLPLPPERERSSGQRAQIAAAVAGALTCLAPGDPMGLGQVKVGALVGGLAALDLDRADVHRALERLRAAGGVELRPEASRRFYTHDEQKAGFHLPPVPGVSDRGAVCLSIGVLPGLALLAAVPAAPPPAPVATARAARTAPSKGSKTPAPKTSKAARGAGGTPTAPADPDLLALRAIAWCDAYGRGGFAALSRATEWEESHVRKVLGAKRPVPDKYRAAVEKALQRSANAAREARKG